MRRIIAVIDPDIRFALRLADFLSAEERLPLKAVAYSSFSMYANESASLEVLLFICSEEQVEACVETGKPVVMLTEDGLVNNLYQNSQNLFVGIFKYSSVHTITDEILSFMAKHDSLGFGRRGQKRGRILGIYSPVNRCGKTSLSVLVHSCLQEQKHSSLLLSFDEYDAVFAGLRKPKSKDFSDVLYAFKSGQLRFDTLGACITRSGNLNIILPARYQEDLFFLSEEEWTELIQKIQEAMDLEFLIIDFGTFGRRCLNLLALCDWICMPDTGGETEQSKIADFKALLERSKNTDVLSKLQSYSCSKQPDCQNLFEGMGIQSHPAFSRIAQMVGSL